MPLNPIPGSVNPSATFPMPHEATSPPPTESAPTSPEVEEHNTPGPTVDAEQLRDFMQFLADNKGTLDVNANGLDYQDIESSEAPEIAKLDQATFDLLAQSDANPTDGLFDADTAATPQAIALNAQAQAALAPDASQAQKDSALSDIKATQEALGPVIDDAQATIDAFKQKLDDSMGDLTDTQALDAAWTKVCGTYQPQTSDDNLFQVVDGIESGLPDAEKERLAPYFEHIQNALNDLSDDEISGLAEAFATRNLAQGMLTGTENLEGVLTGATDAASTDEAGNAPMANAYLDAQIGQFGMPLTSDYLLAGMVRSGQIANPDAMSEAEQASLQSFETQLAEKGADGVSDDFSQALAYAGGYLKDTDSTLKSQGDLTDADAEKALSQRIRWELGYETTPDKVDEQNIDVMAALAGGDDTQDATLLAYSSVANQIRAEHPELLDKYYTTEARVMNYSFSAVEEATGWEDPSSDIEISAEDSAHLNRFIQDNQLDMTRDEDRQRVEDEFRTLYVSREYPNDAGLADKVRDLVELDIKDNPNPSVGQSANLEILTAASMQANRAFNADGSPVIADPYARAAQLGQRMSYTVDQDGKPSLTLSDPKNMSDKEAKEGGFNGSDTPIKNLNDLIVESVEALQKMRDEINPDSEGPLPAGAELALGLACPVAGIIYSAFNKPEFTPKQAWAHDYLEAQGRSTQTLDELKGKADEAWRKGLLTDIGITLGSVVVAAVPAASAAMRAGASGWRVGMKAAAAVVTDLVDGTGGLLTSSASTAGKAFMRNISDVLPAPSTLAPNSEGLRLGQDPIMRNIADVLPAPSTLTPNSEGLRLGQDPIKMDEAQQAKVVWGQDAYYPDLGSVEIDGTTFATAKTQDGIIIGQADGKDRFRATDTDGGFIGFYNKAENGEYFRGGLKGGAGEEKTITFNGAEVSGTKTPDDRIFASSAGEPFYQTSDGWLKAKGNFTPDEIATIKGDLSAGSATITVAGDELTAVQIEDELFFGKKVGDKLQVMKKEGDSGRVVNRCFGTRNDRPVEIDLQGGKAAGETIESWEKLTNKFPDLKPSFDESLTMNCNPESILVAARNDTGQICYLETTGLDHALFGTRNSSRSETSSGHLLEFLKVLGNKFFPGKEVEINEFVKNAGARIQELKAGGMSVNEAGAKANTELMQGLNGDPILKEFKTKLQSKLEEVITKGTVNTNTSGSGFNIRYEDLQIGVADNGYVTTSYPAAKKNTDNLGSTADNASGSQTSPTTPESETGGITVTVPKRLQGQVTQEILAEIGRAFDQDKQFKLGTLTRDPDSTSPRSSEMYQVKIGEETYYVEATTKDTRTSYTLITKQAFDTSIARPENNWQPIENEPTP